MAAKWLDLFSNGDGKLSRTQITLNIMLVLSVMLILAHVVSEREILSWPVLIMLGGLHLFALLDRMNARNIDVKFSLKEGATLKMGQGGGDGNA